ncbi:MAG: TolC family outer membrane protein [Pseudomonadota bacterium]
MKHTFKWRGLFLTASAIALFAFGAQANSGSSMTEMNDEMDKTLVEAIESGLATNPEFEVVRSSRRATDEELRQGDALFLPSLDVFANGGYEFNDDPATRSGIDNNDNENLWRYDSSVTLTQLLYNGGEAHYEVQRQKARVASSAHRVRETSEFVGLAIVEGYLEVLRQRQLLVIARQNVAAHVDILGQIKDGVDAGRSTQADLEQAKARMANASALEASTLQSLKNAEAQYRRQVGVAPGYLELPEIPYDALEEDVEREVEAALAYNPTIDIFEADIEAAYAEAEQTKAAFYPQVDLELNARRGHDLNGIEGRDTSASALVVANWNLYRGGGDTARVKEFIHRHQQAKAERADTARRVEEEVRQTWASMVAAAQRAEEFAAQADANVEVVSAYKDQFNLDRRTLLDVLDSQNELFVSRSNTINAEFLETFAVFRLLALKAALLPTTGLDYVPETQIVSSEDWSVDEKMKAR